MAADEQLCLCTEVAHMVWTAPAPFCALCSIKQYRYFLSDEVISAEYMSITLD